MKFVSLFAAAGIALFLNGCMSAAKVQEQIDASNVDYTDRLDAHDSSIDVLRQSALTSLEKSKENAALLEQIQAELVEMNKQIKTNKGFAEASKVMSAANTVKVAELDEELSVNSEADAETKERMMEIDKLYESVMIAHYQKIVDSATEAVELLKNDGWMGGTNAPVNIDEPIEIVAPAAIPATNAAPAGNEAAE